MAELTEARAIIDRVDREMARLFAQRMQAVTMVADYKSENGLPVDDPAREEEMIARESSYVPAAYRPYYAGVLASMIEESKKYQRLLLAGDSVAYSGVPGAFAHVALERIFGEGRGVSCPDFSSAYHRVESGECSAAVLPIENSYAGDVGQVMDLAFHGSLSVSGVYDLPLTQALLGKPGMTLGDVREVISHPQAIAQCLPYLKKRGWIRTPAVNTAVAAKELAESDRTDAAVIASAENARLYGLTVLADDINQQKNNTTRFAVFTAAPCVIRPEDRHFILLFSCKNEPGSLGRAISVISRHEFNLKCLKSHPTGEENWEYYFYAEGDGNLAGEAGQEMIRELSEVCSRARVLGSFSEEKRLVPSEEA